MIEDKGKGINFYASSQYYQAVPLLLTELRPRVSAALSIWPKTADLNFEPQIRPTPATALYARAE
jgi:hypothetical protein